MYSVRVSSDIPLQSDYIPFIMIYYLFSTLFTLISFLWFITAEYYSKQTYLPNWMVKLAKIIKLIRDFLRRRLNKVILR